MDPGSTSVLCLGLVSRESFHSPCLPGMRWPQELQTSLFLSVMSNGQDRASGLTLSIIKSLRLDSHWLILGPNVGPSLSWSLLLGRVEAWWASSEFYTHPWRWGGCRGQLPAEHPGGKPGIEVMFLMRAEQELPPKMYPVHVCIPPCAPQVPSAVPHLYWLDSVNVLRIWLHAPWEAASEAVLARGGAAVLGCVPEFAN